MKTRFAEVKFNLIQVSHTDLILKEQLYLPHGTSPSSHDQYAQLWVAGKFVQCLLPALKRAFAIDTLEFYVGFFEVVLYQVQSSCPAREDNPTYDQQNPYQTKT